MVRDVLEEKVLMKFLILRFFESKEQAFLSYINFWSSLSKGLQFMTNRKYLQDELSNDKTINFQRHSFINPVASFKEIQYEYNFNYYAARAALYLRFQARLYLTVIDRDNLCSFVGVLFHKTVVELEGRDRLWSWITCCLCPFHPQSVRLEAFRSLMCRFLFRGILIGNYCTRMQRMTRNIMRFI